MSTSFSVIERDGSGRVIATYANGLSRHTASLEGRTLRPSGLRRSWRRLLSDVFLPEGYPFTVSSDYLRYQILNALQAFCSSLASLFASRAVLQGYGVGNASASATNAILLTVVQDAFSRLTTIVAGYSLGTSLYPEAKRYRLLADFLNDAALISDTLSPHLSSFALTLSYPFIVPATDSPLRVVALCLSGGLRALCGAVAGGSKAALTVHFATSGERPGDVGDLSAKDGSKETVLSLLGMLCGSVVLHYVHSARMTYVVLFALILGHLAANVAAVRAIALRVFNRQRASIAWSDFRQAFRDNETSLEEKPAVLDYVSVARRERIFADPARIPCSSSPRGGHAHCSLGVSFASLAGRETLGDDEIVALLRVFASERYILWYTADPLPKVHVVLKDGHGPHDHLKAWAHAHEVAASYSQVTPRAFEERLNMVQETLDQASRLFPAFLDAARVAGWKTEESVLVGGSPVTISVSVGERADEGREDKKTV
ncbi:DUF647-domain-containing protein [Trametes polyzona]|nr:DUF647-domain-containing protein [Trametes polyzona]